MGFLHDNSHFLVPLPGGGRRYCAQFTASQLYLTSSLRFLLHPWQTYYLPFSWKKQKNRNDSGHFDHHSLNQRQKAFDWILYISFSKSRCIQQLRIDLKQNKTKAPPPSSLRVSTAKPSTRMRCLRGKIVLSCSGLGTDGWTAGLLHPQILTFFP